MLRYKIIVQYDGTAFYGWQTQKSERTIQGELELALKKINDSKKGTSQEFIKARDLSLLLKEETPSKKENLQ